MQKRAGASAPCPACVLLTPSLRRMEFHHLESLMMDLKQKKEYRNKEKVPQVNQKTLFRDP